MLTNYHTHTTRCGHAEGTEEEYILTALRCGFKVLGFSDHAPWELDVVPAIEEKKAFLHSLGIPVLDTLPGLE